MQDTAAEDIKQGTHKILKEAVHLINSRERQTTPPGMSQPLIHVHMQMRIENFRA